MNVYPSQVEAALLKIPEFSPHYQMRSAFGLTTRSRWWRPFLEAPPPEAGTFGSCAQD